MNSFTNCMVVESIHWPHIRCFIAARALFYGLLFVGQAALCAQAHFITSLWLIRGVSQPGHRFSEPEWACLEFPAFGSACVCAAGDVRASIVRVLLGAAYDLTHRRLLSWWTSANIFIPARPQLKSCMIQVHQVSFILFSFDIFSFSQLSFSNFSFSKFRFTAFSFSKCCLSKLNFSNVGLRKFSFGRLSFSKLDSASLAWANLALASVASAHVRSFSKCSFSNVSFRKFSLSKLSFRTFHFSIFSFS